MMSSMDPRSDILVSNVSNQFTAGRERERAKLALETNRSGFLLAMSELNAKPTWKGLMPRCVFT